MQKQVTCNIVLEKPLPGVVYGLQKGSGAVYETIQQIKAGYDDLLFTFSITLILGSNNEFDCKGPFVQGPQKSRFIYINIGTSAGQVESFWTRRSKVPLTLDNQIITHVSQHDDIVIQTAVPGIGKDGGPNCATVKPFAGWTIAQQPGK